MIFSRPDERISGYDIIHIEYLGIVTLIRILGFNNHQFRNSVETVS